MALTLAAVLSGSVFGCTGAAPTPSTALSAPVVAPLVDELSTTAQSTLPATRLADGLVAPTNRWFSPLVFGDEPVFPLPLSFALTEGGFEFGLPTVTSAPALIAAPAVAQLAVTTGAGESVVTRYDEVSVTIATAGSGAVTIARGSPLVSFTASASTELGLTAAFSDEGDGVYSAVAEGQRFGLVTGGSVDGTRLTLTEGQVANWFPLPVGVGIHDLAGFAREPLNRVTTRYSSTSSEASTTLRYSTGSTLFGALPHQRDGLVTTTCTLGFFATVYGEMQLCGGTDLAWTVPTVEPRSALDLSGLSSDDRAELEAQLGRDIAETDPLPTDTYFGGKALARLATLLQLARSLDATAAMDSLTGTLTSALREWTQPEGCEQRAERCFAYDESVRGIVGQTASFGSDQFNDHHFHYGYFLFAAGVAAEDDPKLAAELEPVMTLLAADIASGSPSRYFPTRRVFDPYSGHSWASGFAPFRDGNNQESSSEAVAAWNGLAAWADAVDDRALAGEARWMLSAEAHSATRYWTNFDETTPPYAGYDRSVVGIVWDGKRDYGTWFSAEPSAILGIQLLPLSPVGDYLAGDPGRIRKNIAEASPPGQFSDYLLMYRALAGAPDAAEALEAARNLPSAAVDDGNSRSYLLAWIMRLR
ncbi:glycosyl hydrolase [Conyzicola sp.]|uniref:glycosyl hydrolase n=1 Tax=Conyzicola sp. TaxID=1969404 RepID=UPI0039897638